MPIINLIEYILAYVLELLVRKYDRAPEVHARYFKFKRRDIDPPSNEFETRAIDAM